MNAQDYTPPDTWNDEETIEADMRAFLLTDYVAHDEKVLQAFRAGWKAGAYYSAFQMFHWIRTKILGIEEPERNEQNDGNE